MKLVKYLLLAATSIFFIASCQKELDFETDGLAHGTLKSNITGDCLPSTINGIYKADSLLNNTNFIDIQVELTTTGTYDIKSDTINGYSFRGTGTLGFIGTNTIRLYATGKPVVAGTDAFTITFDNSICIINVTVIGAGTGVAVYTLGGSPNTCSGAVVNGTYTAGTPLDVNNTVTITVNVTVPGTYTLATASVNGMVFTSIGVFTIGGVQAVTLNGTGTPAASGVFNVTPTNLASSCTFSITVVGGGPAVYTLDGNPGACTGAVSAGTYTAGTVLTSANTVTVNVTVATAGTYTITSNTDDGISFSATNTFATTGPQPVVLIGTGTPTAGGTFNFTATGAGGTSCTFSVTVANAPPPPNLDYQPETSFSNWSDKLVGGTAGDTSYLQVNPNSMTVNGVSYRVFEYKELGTPTDTFFHRKNGGMYYQIFDDTYGFDNNFNTEGLLLDSNLAVNATWNINLGSNAAGGIPATGIINCKIIEKGATATVAGNNYTNIIKVTYTYNYNIGSGDTVYFVEEIWYAKGKGVVYYKGNDVPVTFTDVWETTRIQIF
jgi:hypothetical protein